MPNRTRGLNQHCSYNASLFRLSSMPTFAEYLEKWLKQFTAQGLTNPLVKMPVTHERQKLSDHPVVNLQTKRR